MLAKRACCTFRTVKLPQCLHPSGICLGPCSHSVNTQFDQLHASRHSVHNLTYSPHSPKQLFSLRRPLLLPSVSLHDTLYSTHTSAHNEHPAKAAWRKGTLGFGFSAGGLLFSYFTGVTEGLAAGGLLLPGKQPLAGSSAGALVAAAVNCGLGPRELLQLCIDMVHDCKANGTMYRLGGVLRGQLEQHLPEDAHTRCSGRTFVHVTRLYPSIKSVVKSKFTSKDELITALLTSCHIPYYFDGNMATYYQDGWYADGALSRPLPSPPGVDYTVKVCCFPTKLITTYFEGIDISIAPIAEEEFSHTLWEYFGWAVLPSSEREMTRLHEKGRRDAEAWVKLIGIHEDGEGEGDAAVSKVTSVLGR